MYAGKITFIGTEHGVGARNAGTIMAADGSGPLGGVGELVVTAAGRLENIGTMQAARRADIAAQSLANSGRIASGGDLKIATPGTLGNPGILEAQSLQLASAGDLDNRGGTLRQTSAAALTLTAPVLSNTAGGVIGAEPLAETPAQPGTGSSDPTTPGAGTGTGTGTSTGTETGAGSSGGGTGTTSSPSYVPAPGHITAAGSVLNDGGSQPSGWQCELAGRKHRPVLRHHQRGQHRAHRDAGPRHHQRRDQQRAQALC
jgi:filamentous hemagglutinin